MTEEFKPDRTITLTEEQISEIANKAADKVYQQFYIEVGKSVLSKLLWIVGAAAGAAYLYFKGKA